MPRFGQTMRDAWSGRTWTGVFVKGTGPRPAILGGDTVTPVTRVKHAYEPSASSGSRHALCPGRCVRYPDPEEGVEFQPCCSFSCFFISLPAALRGSSSAVGRMCSGSLNEAIRERR